MIAPSSSNDEKSPTHRSRRSRLVQNATPAMRARRREAAAKTKAKEKASSPLSPRSGSRPYPQQPANLTLQPPPPPPPATKASNSSKGRTMASTPRTVTPTSVSSMSSSNWEEFDEGVFRRNRNSNQRPSPLDTRPHMFTYEHASSSSPSFGAKAPAVGVEDDEMPMDEMADSLRTRSDRQSELDSLRWEAAQSKNELRRLQALVQCRSFDQHPTNNSQSSSVGLNSNKQPILPVAVNAAARAMAGASTDAVPADDVSSLGGVEEHESGLARIVHALKRSSSSSPSNLSPEENALWECIQQTITGMSTEHNLKRRTLERSVQESSAELDRVSLKENELQMQLQDAQSQIADLKRQVKLFAPEDRASGVLNLRERVKRLEEELRTSRESQSEREAEHDQEVRAIQRVLADVTSEREDEVNELNSRNTELVNQVNSLRQEIINLGGKNNGNGAHSYADQVSQPKNEERVTALESEVAELKKALKDAEEAKLAITREMDMKSRRVISLERDLKLAKTQQQNNEGAREKRQPEVDIHQKAKELKKEVDSLRSRQAQMESDLQSKDNEIKGLKSQIQATETNTSRTDSGIDVDSVSSQEHESLKKSLDDTSSSLENAKKIITSLENANSSLALESRAKLKAKEEDLATIQMESADRKRRLDSLATELRDLQKHHGKIERTESKMKSQLIRQKALMSQLEKYMSELQSASVVHEVSSASGTPDSTNIDHVSDLMNNTMIAIKATLDAADEIAEDFGDDGITDVDSTVCGSEVGRQIDSLIRNDREAAAKDLRQELDSKKSAIKRLQDTLKKQSEEVKRLRNELDSKDREKEEMEKTLRAEIKSLREQCSTSMEVLAKKERELSVLRSSLKVDEDDGGYISDDASDGDDEGDVQGVTSPARFNGYGPSHTEALATLHSLSQSTGGIDVPGRVQELESLKNELTKIRVDKDRAMKDLQMERESLANAKMIISSLEKANKSMMEDLRSRLQDSNTAIASLLDKSMEHEKATAVLREELERVKRERDEERQKHLDEVKKGKANSKATPALSSSKDRNLDSRKVGKDGKPLLEEKKDERDGTIEIAGR